MNTSPTKPHQVPRRRGGLASALSFAWLAAVAHAAPTYYENFDDGAAQDWSSAPSPSIGTWSVTNGVYGNSSSSVQYQIGRYFPSSGGTWTTDYILRGSVRPTMATTGKWVGLVFNYQDVNNYHYVIVDTSGSVRKGRVSGGTRGESTSAVTFSGATSPNSTRPWVEIEVVRHGTLLDVRVNGTLAFENFSSTQPYLAGRVGVVTYSTTGNQGQFDNISVTPQASRDSARQLVPVYAQNFNSATIPSDWQIESGAGWSMQSSRHLFADADFEDVIFCTAAAASQTTDYTYSATLWGQYSAPGNEMGLRFNRASNGTYGQVLISAGGAVTLVERNGSTTVSSTTGTFDPKGQTVRRWIEVSVVRHGSLTDVIVDGQGVIKDWPTPTLTTGSIGLVADFQDVMFDNVRVINVPYRYKSTFPRLGAMLHGGADSFSVDANRQFVAKYDFALIGGNATDADMIHGYNPNTLLSRYTNAMEVSTTSNSGVFPTLRAKLFGSIGPGGNPNSPAKNDWWARGSDGWRVGEYPGAALTNLTFNTTPDAGGWRYSQWYADQKVTEVFSLGTPYHVWFEDNVFYKYRGGPKYDENGALLNAGDTATYPVDWDRNGTNDAISTDPTTIANVNYRKGNAMFLMKAAQLNPAVLTGGNPDGRPNSGGIAAAGAMADSEYKGLLQSSLIESIIGRYSSAEKWAGWNKMMETYRAHLQNTADPHLVLFGAKVIASGANVGKPVDDLAVYHATNNPVPDTTYNPSGYKFARYAFCSVLMDNGYFITNGPDHTIAQSLWLDEMNQRLGQPEDGANGAPQTGANQVLCRRFQNGAVLVNPRNHQATTSVALRSDTPERYIFEASAPAYKRFDAAVAPNASQNTTVNNNQNLPRLTDGTNRQYIDLPRGDGIVLIKVNP